MTVVGTASTGAEAVDRCRELRPDVLLLDIAMPVMDGLTALPLVKDASPETRVVMFSAFDSPEIRARAEELGADGYVRKGSAPDELVERVRAICRRPPH
jgi:DNA-binding NarL/FixJ family response regulator